MKEFKALCDFESIEFEGDPLQLQENARSALASIYSPHDFGPQFYEEANVEDRALAAKGRKRVRDKISAIKKTYRDGVKENQRSGGGKVVTENWDTLVFLWEGCPSVTSLPYGQRSAEDLDSAELDEITDIVGLENSTEEAQDGANNTSDQQDDAISAERETDSLPNQGKAKET